MEGVLALARQMARAFEAELHLIHVREIAAVPVFPAATIGYPGIGMPDMEIPGALAVDPGTFAPTYFRDEMQKTELDRLQENFSREGVTCFAHEREGTVVEEILKTAREIAANLIVMGTHGHGSVYNLLVGSVTEGILKAAERPVLLVPAPVEKK
jgi:nucleotide-binding universal stress UspA family protein